MGNTIDKFDEGQVGEVLISKAKFMIKLETRNETGKAVIN